MVKKKGIYPSATIRLCSISVFTFPVDHSGSIMFCLSYKHQNSITAAQHVYGQISPMFELPQFSSSIGHTYQNDRSSQSKDKQQRA